MAQIINKGLKILRIDPDTRISQVLFESGEKYWRYRVFLKQQSKPPIQQIADFDWSLFKNMAEFEKYVKTFDALDKTNELYIKIDSLEPRNS